MHWQRRNSTDPLMSKLAPMWEKTWLTLDGRRRGNPSLICKVPDRRQDGARTGEGQKLSWPLRAPVTDKMAPGH